ncbi:MAG: acetyl-CoA carboxylase biotin carboxyl carrier protein [Verrucomicrobia bacterium]|nr:acetyl-CoA carboxylase biotin carboxyl carrier protein [Verrucomicrobiota bacterium]
MEYREIKRIIELMKDNELSEFELQEDDFRIAIKRKNGNDSQVVLSAPQSPVVMAAPAAAIPVEADLDSPPPVASAATESAAGTVIKSPIVGTFYRSSSPDSDPLASVGQAVDEDTVVCIIEAMKIMNEIKAECRGVIRSVLVENATPVEFGQPLFKIDPA